MVLSSLFSALLVVCAWISVPVPPVSFTMQTFGVFLCLGVLGGKWGTVSILLYLLLGLAGLPVFSGFSSGAAVFAGPAAGFLWGFLGAGLVFWVLERVHKGAAMAAGMAACYVCGCVWFSVYAGGAGFAAAVVTCVVPYLVPDGVKIALAYGMSQRIRRSVRI